MDNVKIRSFDDLMRAARQQPEPQRLLFVFAGAELPDDSSPEQRRRFAAGAGAHRSFIPFDRNGRPVRFE